MVESMKAVQADANPNCDICGGHGWHWGWEGGPRRARDPVRLKCPCVDEKRAAKESPNA